MNMLSIAHCTVLSLVVFVFLLSVLNVITRERKISLNFVLIIVIVKC